MTSTPAEHARIQAGYSLEAAAQELGYSVRYLRSLELNGGASLPLARKLAALYGCDGNVFIYPPEYFRQLGQRMAARPFMPPAAVGADTWELNPCASRRYRPPRAPVLTVIPSRGDRS